MTPPQVPLRFQRIFDLNYMNLTMMAEMARWGYVPDTYWYAAQCDLTQT
jgi:hypothetical protein